MSSDTLQIFDRAALRRHRDRAAGGWPAHDFLVREVGRRLVERLDDIRRDFPRVLDLGCHGGTLAELLAGRDDIETLVQCDLSPAMARRAAGKGALTLAADEETLPFAPASFDLAISALSLHWVNDLPGALLQIRQALKPDGLLLAAMIGGESLHELRVAWMQAEIATLGGASPRVSPFAELRDLGNLLQRAGFALPVADFDEIPVTYADPFAAMRELRAMGEANAVADRSRSGLRRETLLRAAEEYQRRFALPDGRVPLTFQVLYLTAWAPHASQPQPLAPGSAKQRLAAALASEERSAGETAPPVPPKRR